jgi:cell division transport system permease protein
MSVQLDQAMIRTPLTWPLRIMIAAIVAVAGLALLAGLGFGVAAAQLDHGLRGQMTVEIPTDEQGHVDAKQVVAILQDLRAVPGVTALPLATDQIGHLLQPWLSKDHAAAELAALPLPQLLDVKAANEAAATQTATMLRQKYPQVIVSDHQIWLNQLAGTLRQLAAVAIIVVVALFVALFSTIIFACRAGLAVHRPMIELLHIIGAPGGRIIGEMRRYAWRLVWPGCLIGLFGAAVAAALIANMAQHLTPVTLSSIPATFWTGTGILGLGMPLLTLIVAALSAQWATRRVLATML